MCGITGAIWTDGKLAVPRDVLRRMTDVLRHRGPDDEGTYISEHRAQSPRGGLPGVALGFRRLSIIDLAGGHQPLSNEDGSVWVVFNGEIYNFEALRRRLEGTGHTFRTSSDTETIVHLYEDEGTDCFQHFNGMFAIAIWDARDGRLVLGRDRLGKKPLVYRHEPGRLLFASELKSLLEVPGPRPTLDLQALDEYFTYQYVPHPRTIYEGIQKLPPGHFAVYADDRLEIRPYWVPNLAHEEPIGEREACERLAELLESSVALRLQSDVPLGAFLSGGVDSSLIVALMRKRATGVVKTFSIGSPVAEYDESPFARRVAEFLGTEHQEFQVDPNGVEILPELVWHFDEPFADSSAIPTWYLARMTRQHVTVSLSGDGGDELFLGYPRYKAMQFAAFLDRTGPFKACLAHPLWQRLPAPARQKSALRQWKRFSESLRLPPLRRYLNWIAIYHEHQRAELYTDAFIERLSDSDPIEFLAPYWSRVAVRDAATAASLVDLRSYLPCDLMTKVDIASMAHGLECRQPFLDYRVVEFAASLPQSLKWRVGRGAKRILRKAFGPLLPAETWKRRKMGFSIPLDHWFRGELNVFARQVLLDRSSACGRLFRRETIEKLLTQHRTGQFDHAYRLWSLLVFETWRDRWNVTV